MVKSKETLTMLSRDGGKNGLIMNLASRRCQMEGCTGHRIHVKWEDGRSTYPCSKGCKQINEHTYQIQ